MITRQNKRCQTIAFFYQPLPAIIDQFGPINIDIAPVKLNFDRKTVIFIPICLTSDVSALKDLTILDIYQPSILFAGHMLTLQTQIRRGV